MRKYNGGKYHAIKVSMFDQGITQGEMAKYMGISEYALNMKLNQKTPFTVEEAAKIIHKLNIENAGTIFFS